MCKDQEQRRTRPENQRIAPKMRKKKDKGCCQTESLGVTFSHHLVMQSKKNTFFFNKKTKKKKTLSKKFFFFLLITI